MAAVAERRAAASGNDNMPISGADRWVQYRFVQYPYQMFDPIQPDY